LARQKFQPPEIAGFWETGRPPPDDFDPQLDEIPYFDS
jgi:hypothetical protein